MNLLGLDLKISHLLRGIEKLTNIELSKIQFYDIIKKLENIISVDLNNHEDRKLAFDFVVFELQKDTNFKGEFSKNAENEVNKNGKK